MNHAAVIAMVGLSLVALSSPAVADEACPLVMPKDSVVTHQVPAGWKARVSPVVRLTSAGMLHGAFDGSGYLKPTTTKSTKGADATTFTSTWEFGPAPHPPKWLVCEYGNAVELYKPIGQEIAACTMVTSTAGRRIRKIALDCRRSL